MSAERWRQLEDLYYAALKRDAADRAAFLAQADPELRREVEALLAQERTRSFLDPPTAELSREAAAERRRFGCYEVISLLGKGGMGEVFLAHDPRLGRDVAIKTLPREYASEAEWLARFRREARLLAALNHPNIAVIHGLEESGGEHYLVMELVGGETLAE